MDHALVMEQAKKLWSGRIYHYTLPPFPYTSNTVSHFIWFYSTFWILEQIYVCLDICTEALLNIETTSPFISSFVKLFCDIFIWLEHVWWVGGCLLWLHVGFPVLQPVAGDLEVDVPGSLARPALLLRPRLREAGVQGGENPTQDRQHQEHWKLWVTVNKAHL